VHDTDKHEPDRGQVIIWADDIAASLRPWLSDFDDDIDAIRFLTVLRYHLREIATAAHAAGMLDQRRATELEEMCAKACNLELD
jgi:hypothetical protein